MQIEISMKFHWFLLIAFFLIISGCCKTYQCKQDYYQITYDDLENKIQGGLLGQIFGNLNGLPYEFKFFNEPGEIEEYYPSLPEGGRTDDDTGGKKEWAQAVYYAISLEIAKELITTFPDEWARAVEALDDYPDAEKIVIYGNFTNYSKFETIFGKENAKWVCRVDINPGIYNYLFLIINRDGTQEWLPDPNNPDQQRHIDGYYYSFLEVK
jgi:hypothetical protein